MLLLGHCRGIHVATLASMLEGEGHEVRILASDGAESFGDGGGNLARIITLPSNQAVNFLHSLRYYVLGRVTINQLVLHCGWIERIQRLTNFAVSTSFSLNPRKSYKLSLSRPLWELQNKLRIKLFFREFDVCHLHYMAPQFSSLVDSMDVGTPLVVSIWGSDLLRIAGLESHIEQSKIIERADAITICSLEMREILLAKFGRHLQEKISETQFASGIVRHIDTVDNDTKAAFARKYNLLGDRKVICVGHNSFRENQQLAVLNQLANTDTNLLKSHQLVIPATYGTNDQHLPELKTAANRTGFHCVFLEDELTPEEVAALRVLTSVMIHVPVSDAMSAAMTEVLYAGNQVIAGAWLPYGELHRRELKITQVKSLQEVVPALEKIVNCTQADIPGPNKENTAATKLGDLVHWDQAYPAWRSVYEEVTK